MEQLFSRKFAMTGVQKEQNLFYEGEIMMNWSFLTTEFSMLVYSTF